MSSARMITTFGGPGGGVGEGRAATGGDGGAVGELPPQAVVRQARAEPRKNAVRRELMNRNANRSGSRGRCLRRDPQSPTPRGAPGAVLASRREQPPQKAGGLYECGRLVLRPGRQAVGASGRRAHRPSRGHNGSAPVRLGLATGPPGVDGSRSRPRDRGPAPAAATAGEEARPARAASTARTGRRGEARRAVRGPSARALDAADRRAAAEAREGAESARLRGPRGGAAQGG